MTKLEFEKFIQQPKERTVTWLGFKEFVQDAKRASAYLGECQKKNSLCPHHEWFPIYRGHRDSSWGLQSTLERAKFPNELPEYHKIVLKTQKKYTDLIKGQELDVKEIDAYPYDDSTLSSLAEELSKENQFLKIPECLRFWLFLRHYGFPSPFLDWSKNPLVAAFFAFREQSAKEYVSMYVFMQGAVSSSGANLILFDDRDSGDINSPVWLRRHREQESVYTFFFREQDTNERAGRFESHDEIWNCSGVHNDWGFGFKFNILASERMTVLKELDMADCNAARLLGNTDARLETIYNQLVFEEQAAN